MKSYCDASLRVKLAVKMMWFMNSWITFPVNEWFVIIRKRLNPSSLCSSRFVITGKKHSGSWSVVFLSAALPVLLWGQTATPGHKTNAPLWPPGGRSFSFFFSLCTDHVTGVWLESCDLYQEVKRLLWIMMNDLQQSSSKSSSETCVSSVSVPADSCGEFHSC